jgi:hypothetical protein
MALKKRQLTAVQVLAMILLALATPSFAQVVESSPKARAKRTVLVAFWIANWRCLRTET